MFLSFYDLKLYIAFDKKSEYLIKNLIWINVIKNTKYY